MAVHAYALERLFVDQAPGFVSETIAPVLAWVPRGKRKRSPPFRFAIERSPGAAEPEAIDLSWDADALDALVPGLAERTAVLRDGSSALGEDVAKLAAYGLAFVAISLFLPGRRVVRWNRWRAPDMLLDDTPGALRGVEVAGRTTGGSKALHKVAAAKRAAIVARLAVDIAEAHLSLWCASARLGIMEEVHR